MFPPRACERLAAAGHDAVHVRDRGVDGRPDPEVAELARHEDRVLITENVKDFAHERDLVILCVLKSRLPAQGMAEHLAAMVQSWADSNPRPYRGLHWPVSGGT